ncbi:MAG: glycosyltransferase family 4 protein [Nitrospiraceae bacterium]
MVKATCQRATSNKLLFGQDCIDVTNSSEVGATVPKEWPKATIALCTAGELYGGIEAFVLALAKQLRTSGDANVLCVLFQDGELADELLKHDVPVRIVRERHKYDMGVIGQLRDIFRQGDIEIIHTNGYKANLLCGIAGRWAGAKLVKTEHGVVEPDHGRAPLKMRLNVKMDELVSRMTHDAVVFVSKDLERLRGPGYGRASKGVIYNGIGRNGTEGDGQELDRDARGAPARVKVCTVGRLTEIKGHLYLLRAMRQLGDLDNLEVHIFGNGPLEEELQLYCARHGLTRQVIFRGFVRPIEPHLRQMDAMVIPSLHEGIPYAVLEGMAQGLAIVASAVGGIPEILRDGDTALLVAPRDDNGLACAIRSLYEDAGLRRRLGRNARRKVTTDLSIGAMAERYLHVYERLARS